MTANSFLSHSGRPSSLVDAIALLGPPAAIPLRVLLVDPHGADRTALRRHLEPAGFAIDEAADGRTAQQRLKSVSYGLIVLDVALPDVDGLTLCRSARLDGASTDAAIVVVTASNHEADKVLALTCGADDYVTKPFGVRELLARVGAVIRRTRRAADVRGTSAQPLTLDVARRQAIVDGRRVELTRQEFEVLHQLAGRPGTVFSRATLLRSIWGEDTSASERTVDVAISRLRRKLEVDPHEPRLILTAWGIGYKFSTD